MSQHCPEHRAEHSHGKADMKRSQVAWAPEPQISLQCPLGVPGNTGILGMDCQWKREGLCQTPVCTSDTFLSWSSSNYLGLRGFITALLTLPDFSLLLLICFPSLLLHIAECLPSFQHVPPSKHIQVCFEYSDNGCDKVLPQEFSSVLRFVHKLHSVRRPKRRRMLGKGSPSAVLSCGDQPLVWSGQNVTEAMSCSKENFPWPLHSVQEAEKKLQY